MEIYVRMMYYILGALGDKFLVDKKEYFGGTGCKIIGTWLMD